jgi:hypothetical protein
VSSIILSQKESSTVSLAVSMRARQPHNGNTRDLQYNVMCRRMGSGSNHDSA